MRKVLEIAFISVMFLLISIFCYQSFMNVRLAAFTTDSQAALDSAASANNITAYNQPTIPTPLDSLSIRLSAANTTITITP